MASGLADVGQELVAEARALGRALDDAGDVHERYGHPRLIFSEPKISASLSAAMVRQRDDTLVGFDRCERIVAAARRTHDVNALNNVDFPTFGRPTIPRFEPTSSLV